MDQSPAFIATEVTLPGSGRVVEVRVSSKWTVDQVKQHCFKTIPDLQAQRKNDFNVGLSENDLLLVEFVRFAKANKDIEQAIRESGKVRLGIYAKGKGGVATGKRFKSFYDFTTALSSSDGELAGVPTSTTAAAVAPSPSQPALKAATQPSSNHQPQPVASPIASPASIKDVRQYNSLEGLTKAASASSGSEETSPSTSFDGPPPGFVRERRPSVVSTAKTFFNKKDESIPSPIRSHLHDTSTDKSKRGGLEKRSGSSDKGLLSPTVASASPLPAAPKTTSQAKVEFSVPLLIAKPVEPPLVAAPVAHVELPRVAAPAEHDHDELFRRASTRTSLVLDSPLEASLQADPFSRRSSRHLRAHTASEKEIKEAIVEADEHDEPHTDHHDAEPRGSLESPEDYDEDDTETAQAAPATSTLVPRPSEDDIPPSRSSGAGISLDDTHIESVVSESGARRNSIVKTRSFLGLHKKGKEPEPSIPGGSGLPDIVEKSMHAKMSKRSSLLFLSIKPHKGKSNELGSPMTPTTTALGEETPGPMTAGVLPPSIDIPDCKPMGSRPLAHNRQPQTIQRSPEELEFALPSVSSAKGWVVEKPLNVHTNGTSPNGVPGSHSDEESPTKSVSPHLSPGAVPAAATTPVTPPSPPRSKDTARESFALEPTEATGNHWFKDFFSTVKDVKHYVGTSKELGPFVVSALLDGKRTRSAFPLYRCLLRTQYGDDFISFPSSLVRISMLRPKPTTRDLLKIIEPKLVEGDIALIDIPEKDVEKFSNDMVSMEDRQFIKAYKFGVLYVSEGQTTEEAMFGNEHGSPAFDRFLESLGERVKLLDWKKFRAGLDTTRNTTGSESIYTTYSDYEIMLHVSTLLPHKKKDVQQLERKRHIGNDIGVIIYREGNNSGTPYRPNTIESEFIHVLAIVDAQCDPQNPNDETDRYSIHIATKQDVPLFGPPTQDGYVYSRDNHMREFLLSKLINGENACFQAPTFLSKIRRTRVALYKNLFDTFVKNS